MWQASRDAIEQDKLLKKAIWAYFILLIFEGALRKWFLPFLSTPLLLVRDPIAVYVVVMAYSRGLLPKTVYLSGMVAVGVIATFTAVLFGHGNLMVALYGARILIFHFPMIFVIGRLFTKKDVIAMGKVITWITVPMTILIALQFYSPQSAWVNRGVGGDVGGAGFTGALGYFRPPATFSFTTGTSLFYSLAACFIIYFWINRSDLNKMVHIAATIGLLAAIPLSISRGLFFQVGLSVMFAILASVRNPRFMGSIFLAVIGTVIGLALLSHTSFFQTASAAFFNRFELGQRGRGRCQWRISRPFFGRNAGCSIWFRQHAFFWVWSGYGYQCWQHGTVRRYRVLDLRRRVGAADWRNGRNYGSHSYHSPHWFCC